jgi:putative multicomponent Na+:H+ antiporter subunit B
MTDSYVYAIVALLPLAALMVVIQGNPYQALVIRGILGAVAALVYAVLGGADVALTEALVGTLLAITLYAVAVRSSLVMRLGVLEPSIKPESTTTQALLTTLRAILRPHHLRLELVPYADPEVLAQALQAKEIHGSLVVPGRLDNFEAAGFESQGHGSEVAPLITLRVPRLQEILRAELPPELASIQEASPLLVPSPPPLLTEKPL